MIKTKTVKKTIKEKVVKDVICNKCGQSLKTDCGYEGLVETEIRGGYNSKIGDMTIVSFSLCEDCLLELFKTFTIKEQYQDLIPGI
jgi:Fe2+ or Zn2+ uptake regulation protein